MSDFRKMKLTPAGRSLLSLVHSGGTLSVTSVVVGNGTWTAEQQESGNLAGLVSQKAACAVTSIEQHGEQAVVKALLTNAALDAGFNITEIGVIATHPVDGDILYMADYCPVERASYVTNKDAPLVEVPISVDIVCSSSSDVELTIKSTFVTATMEDLIEHDGLTVAHASAFDAHNQDAAAHSGILHQVLAEQRGYRKQLVIDKIMVGAIDTGYPDGFIKDMAEASDILSAESSGYVHDPLEGVFRSIDPVKDNGTVTVDWTQAELENITGAVTTLTVDTANASGHFDVPVDPRVTGGVRVILENGEVGVLSLSGDGTMTDSVNLTGVLAVGEYAVQAVMGLIAFDGALTLSQHDLGYKKVPIAAGNVSGSGFTHHAPDFPQLVDGETTTYTGHGGYNLDYVSASIVIFDFGAPVELVKFVTWTGGGACTDVNNIEYFNESSAAWEVAASGFGPFNAPGSHSVDWPSVGAHRRWRKRQVGGNGGYFHIEHEWFEPDVYAPEGQYYTALTSLSGAIWGAIVSHAVNDGGADSFYAFRFDDEFRVFTGGSWRAIARNAPQGWQYRDNLDTWTDALENTPQCAISSAAPNANNQMLSANVQALADADFAGEYPTAVSVTLQTADSGNIPSAGGMTFDINAANMPMELVVEPQGTVSLPASSPASIMALFGIIPVDEIDPDADILVQVSDDGASYAAAVLEPAVQFVTGQSLVGGIGDVADTNGTQPKIKITVSAGKRIKVDAVGGFWT